MVIPGFDVAIFRLDGVSSSFFSLYFLSLLGGGGCRIFTSSGNSFYGIYRQVPFGGPLSRAARLGKCGNDASRAGHDALRGETTKKLFH